MPPPGLLFLSHRIPYPPDKGEKIRAWNMFRHLAQTHSMHLGCFIDDPADTPHVAMLRAQCADLACPVVSRTRQKIKALLRMRPGRPLTLDCFFHRGMRDWVDAKLASGAVEKVFVYSSAMAPYVMHATRHRRILDMVDIDSEKWTEYARKSRGPARRVWAREGRTLLDFERRAALQFDHTLFVSQAESRRFEELAPECRGRVGWIDNGVDLAYFSPGSQAATPFLPGGPDIVFTGTMDYWPNVDAVSWFARDILPVLQSRRPGLRFHVVGANPSAAVRQLAALPGVDVTGRVPDVRPYLAHAALVVAPLRIARGIQNKVLEAMAAGRPVLASPQAFEGIRARPGRDLLVAEDADAMARCAEEVLAGRHPGLGTAARRAMEGGYAWSATLQGLDALFDGTAGACRSVRRAAPVVGLAR